MRDRGFVAARLRRAERKRTASLTIWLIAEIHAEMRGVRDELARLRTLDSAIDADVERGHRWLN